MSFHFYGPGHSDADKHTAVRRHHIPKMSFEVQNWPAYEARLRISLHSVITIRK
jgi:hypothetical protein